MKKKFISLLSISLGVLISSSFVTACNNDRPLHIWAEDWTYNSTTHWHACTDAGCPGKDAYDYHDFALLSTETEPTCTQEGRGHYKCSVCGYEKDDSIPVIPHDFKLQTTLQAPSCIYEGRGTYKCSVCGHSEDLQIPATGKHSFSRTFKYDDNSHWYACMTEGCDATTTPAPHVEGVPVRVAPNGWYDGKLTTPCKDCGYAMRVIVLPSAKAPASYELQFINRQDNTTITPTPGEIEDDRPTYNLTLKKGVAYSIDLANALNVNGEKLDLSSDIEWHMGDIYQSHGFKLYSVDKRSHKETLIDLNASFGGFSFRSGPLLIANSVGEYKLIFRYETGVNDGNGNTRKIRVEHVTYVTVTEA